MGRAKEKMRKRKNKEETKQRKIRNQREG